MKFLFPLSFIAALLISCAGENRPASDAPLAVGDDASMFDEDEMVADEQPDEDMVVEDPVPEQWNTKYYDRGSSIAVDAAGNIYVTGTIRGNLDGNLSAGDYDAFLIKWMPDSTKAWTKQWGSESFDYGKSVTVDSVGNIYVTGDTKGGMDGNTISGTHEIFLTKLNAEGAKVWTKQWGTVAVGNAVTADFAGNVFVAGYTGNGLDGNTYAGDGCAYSICSDIFLTKWNADGTKAWTKQWGTTEDEQGNSVATDTAGNIYVTGYTYGDLDGNVNAGNFCGGEGPCSEIFLTKWNADGTKAWTKQWVSDMYAHGESVAVDDEGNVYVAGIVAGALDDNVTAGTDCYYENFPPGIPCADIFVTKWTAGGTKVWTKQWGSAAHDYGRSLAVDTEGSLYITGETYGDLDGNINAGYGCSMSPCSDIFLTKWNADGTKAWTQQWGTAGNDRGKSVAVDSAGNIHVTGYTSKN